MKKNLIYLVALLLMASCSKNETLNEQNGLVDVDALTFRASFEGANSRVSISEDGDNFKLAWSANDELAIFTRTTKCKYVYNAADDVFTKAANNVGPSLTTNYYAVYPYTGAAQSITDDGVLSLDMPARQQYAEKSFGTFANTMVAACPKPAEASTEPVALSFKNVCGYLRLYLYGEDITVRSIELRGNNNEVISGTANVKISTDVAPEFTWVSTAGHTIALHCGEGVKLGSSAEQATEFWFVVPPTTFEGGIMMRVTDANGKVMVKSSESKLEISRNMVESMAAAEVEFSAVDPNVLFDAQFNLDGTVTDNGVYSLEVQRMVDKDGKTPYMYTYTHPEYPHNNIVKFKRAVSNIGDHYDGGYKDNYYRVNVSDNVGLQERLQDGFTWEYIVYTPMDAWDIWALPAGSNTFSILRKGAYHNNTFHLRANGTQWGSQVSFTPGVFHHILYIFDKTAAEIRMYIDGEKKSVAGCESFNNTTYIAIGGEPYQEQGAIHQPWNGDIAMMRIYDEPMTPEQVELRYTSLTIPEKPVMQQVPTPMFDAKFNADGTADNVGSLTSLTIQTKANADLLQVVSNDAYTHNNIAKFNHTFKSAPEDGYYMVDYSTNDEFKSKMTDGYYTLEAIISYDLALDTPKCATNSRAKAFGGDYERDWAANAGFDVIEGDENNHWPGFGIWYNQSRDSFVSAAADSSDAKPRCGNADSYAAVHKSYVEKNIHSKQYYHIVAVYDVYNHTNVIYVDGCLNNEGNAEHKGLGRTNLVGVNGVLKLPDAAPNQQFYIGGDVEYFSGVPKLQNTWNGGVAMARIYDEALSPEQIAIRYAEIEEGLSALNNN